MSSPTVENILAQMRQLPPEDLKKLMDALTQGEVRPKMTSRIISTNAPYNDRAREYEWLDKHRREYIGQWVALKDDELIAHGPNAREVFAQVRERGVADAMVLFVEDPSIPFVNV